MKLKIISVVIAVLLFALHCQETGLTPADYPQDQPYSRYHQEDSNQGSVELHMKVDLKKNLEFSHIWLHIIKVEVRVKVPQEEDDLSVSSLPGEHSAPVNRVHDEDDEEVWIELPVGEIKLDAVLFARHQLVFAAGVYDLEPNTYDRVRLTLGPQSSVEVKGQSYPLYASSEHGDNHIKIKGDIEVFAQKLTGVVIDFNPAHDLHAVKAEKHEKEKTVTETRYKIKKEYHVWQNAVVGTNFPANSAEYTMLRNVTIDKAEVCMEEELRVDTSFIYPNGHPGGVSINVGGVNGTSVVVVFHEAGLKLLPVIVTDYNRNVERMEIPVLVKNCTKQGIVRIRQVPNAAQRAHTLVAETPGMTGAITYTWDFGDGQTATTTSPVTTHSYVNRIQSSRIDSFIVSVSASSSGETRSGQTTISMVNPHMVAALFKAQYFLETSSDPFLKKQGASYRGAFVINNPSNLAVNLTSIEQRIRFCNDSTPERVTTLSAQATFGFSSLGNYENRSGEITVSSLPDGVCTIAYTVYGKTVTGNVPANANFYFGVETPAFYSNTTRVSAEKEQEIKAAMKALNYPAKISNEDIQRLKLEGKL